MFTDGRALRIASFEVAGERVMLGLPSEGRIEVPLERIERIVDDEILPEPEAAVAELPGLFPKRSWRFDASARAAGPDNYLALVFEAAGTHDVDPSLVAAVILR